MSQEYHVNRMDLIQARVNEILIGYKAAAKESLTYLGDFAAGYLRSAQEAGIRHDNDSFRRTLDALKEARQRVDSLQAQTDVVLMLREYAALTRALHEALGHLFNTCNNFDSSISDAERPLLYGSILGDIQHVLTSMLALAIPPMDTNRLGAAVIKEKNIQPVGTVEEPLPSCMTDKAPDYTVETFQKFMEGLAA